MAQNLAHSLVPQSTPFSPQRILEKLCGRNIDQSANKPVEEKLGFTVKPPDAAKPPLYALVIGISHYLEHTNLRGAAHDARTFKSYLTKELFVPDEQITTLLDSQATRHAIINAFKNLIIDQRINRDDPIVIYYAGHGAEIDPPSNRQINGPSIQSLVPHDATRPTATAQGIHPIPDFTIGALLNKLADSKGNNITVIFDCCHSASGSRGEDEGTRLILGANLTPLPADVDSEIMDETPIGGRGLVADEEIGNRAMRSHVLLAACGQREQAYEDKSPPYFPGHFTRALLDLLRSIGIEKLTYKSCVQRFPLLTTPKPQNPVCEGTYMDRIFFNALIQGANSSFILIKTKGNQHYLQAGTAQGITPGCIFAVHADLMLDPANPSLGTVVTSDVKPFQSLLKLPKDATTFTIPPLAYGRQVGVGGEQPLDVFITEGFENSAQPHPQWEEVFLGQKGIAALRLTERDQAHVVLDIDNNGNATFTLMKLAVVVANGIQQVPFTVPATLEHVQPVLSAMARWNWHLNRTPQARPFQKSVEMKFFKLEESEEDDDFEDPVFVSQGENLNIRDEANIEVNEDDCYGFYITNTSKRDLYAYLFYFSVHDQTIRPKYTPVLGSSEVDAPLPKGGFLTIGYGSGGVEPLTFRLKEGQAIDVGIFKLFLTTTPIDLDSIKQDSPFDGGRAMVSGSAVEARIEKLPLWDVMTMTLIQRRNPPPASDGYQTPNAFPDNMLPSPTAHQDTVLENTGFHYGICLNLGGPPRQSSQPCVVLQQPADKFARWLEAKIIEDELSPNERDAHLAHFGLPPLESLPSLPWVRNNSAGHSVSATEPRIWTTRRLLISRVHVNFSLTDLQPTGDLVFAIQLALRYDRDWQKVKALEEVFATWGDVIPLTMEVGASIAVTGVGTPENGFENYPPRQGTALSTDDIIEECLGTRNAFESIIGTRVQGGQPMALEEGFDAWLRSTDEFRHWGRIKVTRVAPILDLIDSNLRGEVDQLYRRLTFRSPQVGVLQQFDFDGTIQGLQKIERVIVGFSDSCIERITLRYTGGIVSGPYGPSGDPIRSDSFDIAAGEYITEMLVWTNDQLITSLQFVKNTGHVSVIYGMTQGVSLAPALLNGNGNALAGLSGSFNTAGISQIQGLWRRDVPNEGFRRAHTSSTGGSDGKIFNDLSFLSNRSTSKISQITARTPGKGFLGGLQTTYTSLVSGRVVHSETPPRGWEAGPTTTWILEEGEYITGVRGRHDGTSICELQFTTNQLGESPAFGQASGSSMFSLDPPKTRDGSDMVLQYMVGKR